MRRAAPAASGEVGIELSRVLEKKGIRLDVARLGRVSIPAVPQ